MKKAHNILIVILFFLTSCQENKSDFVYNPQIPYPILNPGDFWLDKFDQRGLQNAIIYFDKIYCNTIDVGGNNNFLYCLNLTNGLVEWRANVKSFASYPATIHSDKIVYCSYLGEISTFDTAGKEIWTAKFGHPYSGHWVDTTNSTLLVTTVAWNGVNIYDINSGKIISKMRSDSLKNFIKERRNENYSIQNQEYIIQNMDMKYTVKVEASATFKDGCIINIEKK